MNREFWNAAGEAAREQPLKAKDKDAAWFAYGAEWAIAGMAVCEFLSDLAVIHLMEMPTWHCVRRCLTVHARGCNCPENSEARRVSP